MEKINQAILSKVSAEAQSIIQEAEAKAREEIEKARKQRQVRFEEERARTLREAEEEAARLLAQASIKARHRLSQAKADAIAKIVDGVRKELSLPSSDENDLRNLIREAMKGLGVDKARVYVSPRDAGTAKRLVEADKELSDTIAEVRESNCLGGVIVEDTEGKLRIDNTYETRLEMLLPRLLPKINRELFGAP